MNDNHFQQEKELIIQDIEKTMKSIVSNLDTLNVYLENTNEIGKEFENVSKLWEQFYTGLPYDKNLSAANAKIDQVTEGASQK
ncbi:hypothetical protein ACO0QE_000748 [Hanseniaspora vineae]